MATHCFFTLFFMLLKEIYSPEFLKTLAVTASKIDKKFDEKKFLKNFTSKDWFAKELKQRMRTFTIALDESLSSQDYLQKITILGQALKKNRR